MAKFLITLTIVCVLGVALVVESDLNATMADLATKIEDCKTEVGAKETDIKELMDLKLPSSRESKCLRACLMEKYGVMDGNGKFVKSVALSHVEKYTEGKADRVKIAHAIIDACADTEADADHCEAAAQYAKCYKIQAEAHGFQDKF